MVNNIDDKTKVIISNLIINNNTELDAKCSLHNALVYSELNQKQNVSFIKNENISSPKLHLSSDGTHPNRKGASILAFNIGKHIRWVEGWTTKDPRPDRRNHNYNQGNDFKPRRRSNGVYGNNKDDRHHRYPTRNNDGNFQSDPRSYRRPRHESDGRFRRPDRFDRRNYQNRLGNNRNNNYTRRNGGYRKHGDDFEQDRFGDNVQTQGQNKYTYNDYRKGRYNDYGF